MNLPLFSLQDQIAIVTGAAKGIGKGIAAVLRQAGAAVVIADIDEAAGQAAAQALGAEFYPLDVTSQADCRRLIEHVVQQHGRVDILCANTGIFPQADLEHMTEADWDTMQNVNLKGTFFMLQAALLQMKPQGYGRIIITSSITGPITGLPGWAHYGASKAGQLGLMRRSAALEYARHGVTINAIQPGNILTEGLQAQGDSYLEQMKAAIPTHTLGRPEDIGYAAAFFAARENAYITGQTLVVDGGQILPESPEALL